MMRNLLLCAGFVLLLAAPLAAGTISYSHSEGPLGVGAAGAFTFPQYSDPGGQPLIKVTLKVDGDSDGGIRIFDNEDPAGGTAAVFVGTDIKVSGPLVGTPLIVHAEPQSSNSGPVAGDNDGGPDFIGTDSIGVTGSFSTDSKSTFRTAALDISPYQGAGTVAMSYTTLYDTAGSFSTTGGGAVFNDPSSIVANFTATITYEFVPEPASGVLAALGIGLVTVFARRRIRAA